MTADLVVWLRAQLDEDERGIRTALRTEDYGVSQRDLLEVESKRRILDEHPRCMCHDRCTACTTCGDGSIWPCSTLRLLALPYADRPGYLEGWRP